MTNTMIDKSQGQSNDQYPAGYTAKLLREAEDNVTVMLQAADLLRELGCERMAIALHARSEMTSAAIALATAGSEEQILT